MWAALCGLMYFYMVRSFILSNWILSNKLLQYVVMVLVVRVKPNTPYSFQVSAWGGYVFIINLIPLHVLVLICIGRFSSRVSVIIPFSSFASNLPRKQRFVQVHCILVVLRAGNNSINADSVRWFPASAHLWAHARSRSIRTRTGKDLSTIYKL